MLKKVRSWGHKEDRNWEDLVEKEFSQEFSGKDFVHGYEFTKVAPFVDLSWDKKALLEVEKTQGAGQEAFLQKANVHKVSSKEVLSRISFIHPLVSFFFKS
jgi:hypothetical protein